MKIPSIEFVTGYDVTEDRVVGRLSILTIPDGAATYSDAARKDAFLRSEIGERCFDASAIAAVLRGLADSLEGNAE